MTHPNVPWLRPSHPPTTLDQLRADVAELARLRRAKRELETAEKAVADRIHELMGQEQISEVADPDGRVILTRVPGVNYRVDTKALAAAYPELAEQFTVKVVFNQLRIPKEGKA